MHTLEYSEYFRRRYKKLAKQNRVSRTIMESVFLKLAADPFDSSLKTHKVQSKRYGIRYSSRVDGDLRVIWNFADNKLKIMLLDLGGHSGSGKVYK